MVLLAREWTGGLLWLAIAVGSIAFLGYEFSRYRDASAAWPTTLQEVVCEGSLYHRWKNYDESVTHGAFSEQEQEKAFAPLASEAAMLREANNSTMLARVMLSLTHQDVAQRAQKLVERHCPRAIEDDKKKFVSFVKFLFSDHRLSV